MNTNIKNNGSAMLLTIFAIALLSALVIGIMQTRTEEVQLMRNQIYAAQAIAIAEAGLNEAFAVIRADSSWRVGINDKDFPSSGPSQSVYGEYTIDVNDTLPPALTITSTATNVQGFVATVAADITVGSSGPPYAIRIDQMRINK